MNVINKAVAIVTIFIGVSYVIERSKLHVPLLTDVFIWSAGLLLWDDPDVAEHDWITVVLDEDGAFGMGEWALDGGGSGEIFLEFQVVVDQHAIEFHRDPGPGGSFALGVECCSGEHDVVGLPGQWWQAHVEAWWGD